MPGCHNAVRVLIVQMVCESTVCIAGNGECCATLPLDLSIEKTLVDETLKCQPEHLAQLMADHTQLDWRPVLGRITIPCLNLIGCHSGVFPMEGCEAVSSLIPGFAAEFMSCSCFKTFCLSSVNTVQRMLIGV